MRNSAGLGKAVIVSMAVLLVAAFTSVAMGGKPEGVKYFEMFIPPDADGYNSTMADNSPADWHGVPQPMRIIGDGFGSKAAGDFDTLPGGGHAGLQLDGTARFVNTGAHGENGYMFRPTNDASTSIYIRMKVNHNTEPGGPMPNSGTGYTFLISKPGAVGTTRGIGIAFDTNRIRLVSGNGTVAESTIPLDLTTWQDIRLYMTGLSGNDGLYVQVGDTLAIPYQAYDDTATTIGPKCLRSTANWVVAIHGTNAGTTYSDVTIDYIRAARDTTQPTPPGNPPPPDPQLQNPVGTVWATPCELKVYPHYVVHSIARGTGPAVPLTHQFTVANTSYPGPTTINWTVTEVTDATGSVATDYAWLALLPSSGSLTSPLQGTAEVVTATLTAASASVGTNTAFLKFHVDSGCSGATDVIREIRLVKLDPAAYKTLEYCGDVLPTDADSAGTGYKFTLWGSWQSSGPELDNVARGSVDDTDTAAVDGKAFRLNITALPSMTVYQGVTNDYTTSWGDIMVDNIVGATVVTRVKVTKPYVGKFNNNVMILGKSYDGVEQNKANTWAHVYYDSSPNYLTWHNELWDKDRYDGTNNAEDTYRDLLAGHADYHVVRLAVVPGVAYPSSGSATGWQMNTWDRKIKMWYDENTTPAIDMVNTVNTNDNPSRWYNGFMFGHYPNDQLVDMSWDWITFTNAGAFAPGEEVAVIGKSLLGGRCDPLSTCRQYDPTHIWADVDNDGDVDQDDFAVFQLCYDTSASTPPSDPANCRCLDRVANNKVDGADFTEFSKCATGPGIVITPQNAPAGCSNPGQIPGAVFASSTFDSSADDWNIVVWKAGGYADGTMVFDGVIGNPGGSMKSTGSGNTNSGDACTREGGEINKVIPTTGYENMTLVYDLRFDPDSRGNPEACAPACTSGWLEGNCRDKVAVYYSIDGGGSWTLLETVDTVDVSRGFYLTRQVSIPAAGDNQANFALRLRFQFNTVYDTGRLDNIRLYGVPQ